MIPEPRLGNEPPVVVVGERPFYSQPASPAPSASRTCSRCVGGPRRIPVQSSAAAGMFTQVNESACLAARLLRCPSSKPHRPLELDSLLAEWLLVWLVG